jgi:hypothetical protein
LAPSWKRQVDIFVAFQRFFSGDDHATAPVDSTRPPSATTMNGDNAARRAFDEGRGEV